jgi:hypothetical protein
MQRAMKQLGCHEGALQLPQALEDGAVASLFSTPPLICLPSLHPLAVYGRVPLHRLGELLRRHNSLPSLVLSARLFRRQPRSLDKRSLAVLS